MARQRIMKMMRATKPFRYDTRMIMAGDTFEVDTRHVRVLRATRKAVEVRETVAIPPPPPEVQAKIAAVVASVPASAAGTMDTASGLVRAIALEADNMAALRDEYRALLGKQAFRGWDAATLRGKIAAAKGNGP